MIAACHKRGIEVHAWLIYHGDRRWVTNHPKDAAYDAGIPIAWDDGPKPANNQKICPLAGEYREYFKGLVRDILDNYDVDGIHLDGIRLSHIVYCFCPRHRQKARELGINLEHVRQTVFNSRYARMRFEGVYVDAYRPETRIS